MPSFLPSESNAARRRAEIFIAQDDNVTPAIAGTNFTGTKASRALSGLTGNLLGAIVSYIAIGTGGNAFTIALVNDGAGIGSLTNVGSSYTFHYQAGVTTINNLIAAIVGIFSLSGAFVGANTLQAGDATTARNLAGGTNNSLFARQGSSFDYAAALGALTQVTIATVPRDGLWVYEFTQAELNHAGDEIALLVDRIPDPASLDLTSKTISVNTIIYDKVAVGRDGNVDGADPQTIAFVNDGAGAGSLTNVGAAWTFHFQAMTTTEGNFADAVAASARFGVKKYGRWANIMVAGDAFAAANLAGGTNYKRPQVWTWPMRLGTFDNLGRGANSYGDITRGMEGVAVGLSSGYNSNPIVFQNPDGTKTVWTVTRDNTGRTVIVPGDLTGP